MDALSIITIRIFYSSLSCSDCFGLAVYFIPPPPFLLYLFSCISGTVSEFYGTYLIHIIEIISLPNLPKGKLPCETLIIF